MCPVLKNKDKFKSLPRKTNLNYRLKSEIKMDKRKLIQIIEKELEELKILSAEIAENENGPSLIIDLTLSKARLLCQEIELLREFTAKENAIPINTEKNEEEQVDKDDVSDVNISDPELEIVDFEEPEFDETPESEDDDEMDSEDIDEDETENEDSDDNLEDVEENAEGLIEFGVNNDDIEEEEEKPQAKPTIESTELKTGAQSGVRQISIDDTNDDDLESVKVTPNHGVADRPVMREIPKPEELVREKSVVEESFQKERSLNDSIGETKSAESQPTIGSISSLRAAIGLNDRFLFIREIFANNTDKYNTVIDHLDKLETIQQAVDYLKANLTLQKNETSMKFVDLLKRRFGK